MPNLISCLMPTYNRFPNLEWLVSEAVECFLRQDYSQKELVICNDSPTQKIVFDHPQVTVYNLPYRFPNLSAKIQFMIDIAKGDILCRWDDDDINLPHRLSMSMSMLNDKLEWRPTNYWYDEQASYGHIRVAYNVANSHVMSIWRREVLNRFPFGKYPPGLSLGEDQAFNHLLVNAGVSYGGEELSSDRIFYIYRWYDEFNNLSARTGDTRYEDIGNMPVQHGIYEITPRWIKNHLYRVKETLQTFQTSV